MGIREIVNKNSALMTIIAAVVMLVSLGTIIMSTRSKSYSPRIVDVYFFDIGTSKLFSAKNTDIAPIKAPSGKQGVRAYVFACGDCAKKDAKFVGWLEMYSPKARAIMIDPKKMEQDPQSFELMEEGHLVSDKSGAKWVSANSQEGFQLMESVQANCKDPKSPPKPCYP